MPNHRFMTGHGKASEGIIWKVVLYFKSRESTNKDVAKACWPHIVLYTVEKPSAKKHLYQYFAF